MNFPPSYIDTLTEMVERAEQRASKFLSPDQMFILQSKFSPERSANSEPDGIVTD